MRITLCLTVPISFGYAPSREAKTVDSPSTYKQCFSFTGTQDFSNIFSITDGMPFSYRITCRGWQFAPRVIALKFREFCGGEERIMQYNHALVLEGASLLANTLGTSYMENSEQSLVACMVSTWLDYRNLSAWNTGWCYETILNYTGQYWAPYNCATRRAWKASTGTRRHLVRQI